MTTEFHRTLTPNGGRSEMNFTFNCCSFLSNLLAPVAASFLIALASGCASRQPPPAVLSPAPVAARPRFDAVASAPITDRSAVSVQQAIEDANQIWSQNSTSRSDYLRASRLLCAALEENPQLNAEDQMRISEMSLEMALLSNDNDVLSRATHAWETAFAKLHRAPLKGEIEVYLIALRATGQPLPADLLAVANPEIRSLLVTGQPD